MLIKLFADSLSQQIAGRLVNDCIIFPVGNKEDVFDSLAQGGNFSAVQGDIQLDKNVGDYSEQSRSVGRNNFEDSLIVGEILADSYLRFQRKLFQQAGCPPTGVRFECSLMKKMLAQCFSDFLGLCFLLADGSAVFVKYDESIEDLPLFRRSDSSFDDIQSQFVKGGDRGDEQGFMGRAVNKDVSCPLIQASSCVITNQYQWTTSSVMLTDCQSMPDDIADRFTNKIVFVHPAPSR